MTVKAIQQFQLREIINTNKMASQTLKEVKDAGFEGIELCSFLIEKTPIIVRILTAFAGMPIGASGKLNWNRLIKESGLKVVSIHDHLGTINKNPEAVISKAKGFTAKNVVITGMHHFDYTNEKAVLELCGDLNTAGKVLNEHGIQLLYHNHNCEFRKWSTGKTAFDMLIEETDSRYVNFEFDVYWPTEAGCDVVDLMYKLGDRMKLLHINDRGSRKVGKSGSIIKSDSIELGYGNINLLKIIEVAKMYKVESIVLESHKNWIDNSPRKSFQLSAQFMNTYV